MRSDNMALYRDLTLYNFVYILLDYPTLFYDLLGEIRYDYSSSVCQLLWYKSVKILRDSKQVTIRELNIRMKRVPWLSSKHLGNRELR